jgi:hypothetical protein
VFGSQWLMEDLNPEKIAAKENFLVDVIRLK